MFKFKRPRAMFEGDGGNGGGAGWDGWAGAGGWTGDANQNATELAKAQAEVVRLGKLLNDKAESDKAREAEEAKKQEEEAKKRWEYEKLYWEQKTQLDELTKNHTTASEQLTRHDEHFKNQYEESIKTLSKEQQGTIEKLLEWKSNFDKATLLPDLLAQFGWKAFGKDPKGGWSSPSDADKAKDLVSKWDFMWAFAARMGTK